MNPRVLLADDDQDLVATLSRRLTGAGYDMASVYDAAAAWAEIERRRPDLVVIDVELPNGNGLAVCEMLAHDERFRDLPVIVLTGRRDQETILRCANYMAYWVHKCPDLWSRLEPVLRDALANRGLEQVDRRPTAAC